jgi:hypothetical protein
VEQDQEIELPDFTGNSPTELPADTEEESGEAAPAPFVGEYSADDVISRLKSLDDVPTRFGALENRFGGAHSALEKRLGTLEASLKTRANFKPEALKELASYDEKLAEMLSKVLPNAFEFGQVDQASLQPFIGPLVSQLQSDFNEQLVRSHYTPEELSEMIPPVKGDSFAPETQRQKDFVAWYNKQGWSTQQALLTLGAPYVRAIRAFERWEEGVRKEREKAAANKAGKLASGGQPSSKGKRSPAKVETADEAYMSAFKDAGLV